MVTFNNDNFVLTIQGDKETYLDTIKLLNDCTTILGLDGRDTFLINNLIACMLPNSRQLINIDESVELDALKQRNRATVVNLTQIDKDDLNNV